MYKTESKVDKTTLWLFWKPKLYVCMCHNRYVFYVRPNYVQITKTDEEIIVYMYRYYQKIPVCKNHF